MSMIDRRKRRQMGEAAWQRTAAATSNWPLQALISGRWQPCWQLPWLRLLVAGIAYLVLVSLHEPAIGVAPWLR